MPFKVSRAFVSDYKLSREPSEPFKVEKRHKRSYAPSSLKVLKGPGENFKKGSTWMVADLNGYAQFTYRRDDNVVKSNSVYIENIEISPDRRGKGFGSNLYMKVEAFARNIGADWIQIDSELEVSGFWVRHGFRKLDITTEGKRIPMIKKIN